MLKLSSKNILLFLILSLNIQAITQSELVNIRFSYFNDHIANLSTDEITKMVEGTIRAAQKNNFNASLVLKQLKTKVQEQLRLYHQEANGYTITKATLIKLALGSVVTVIGATCFIYDLKRDFARDQLRKQKLQQEYDTLAEKLKKRGINIRKETFFHATTIHFEHPFNISPEDERYLNTTSDEMLNLHNQMKSDNPQKSGSVVGPTGACMFVAGIMGIHYTLFPQKDEAYEKKKKNDEASLKNFTILIEQIDLMLNTINN